MPSLLASTFPSLIQNLPVGDHSVEVDGWFWSKRFNAVGLDALHAAIFGTNLVVKLTRDRLLNHTYPSPEQKCAEILIWGYRKNERGIPEKLFQHLPLIASAARSLRPWNIYSKGFPSGTGSSTISKFAYFHRLNFKGFPALILDNRIAREIQRWQPIPPVPGLAPGRGGIPHYVTYLDSMHATAKQIGCTGDQLECFLFNLGSCF